MLRLEAKISYAGQCLSNCTLSQKASLQCYRGYGRHYSIILSLIQNRRQKESAHSEGALGNTNDIITVLKAHTALLFFVTIVVHIFILARKCEHFIIFNATHVSNQSLLLELISFEFSFLI